MAPAEEESPLQKLISKNSVGDVKLLLAQGEATANDVDDHGMSLLQHACYKGNMEMVQMLLDQVWLCLFFTWV